MGQNALAEDPAPNMANPTSAEQGIDSAATVLLLPPAPTEAESKPTKHRRYQKSFDWPGRFGAIRVGGRFGQSMIPRTWLGASGFPSTMSFIEGAPGVGLELGYSERRWGASVSFDAFPLGLLSSSALGAAPKRWSLGIQLHYRSSSKFRWIFGVSPYTAQLISYPKDKQALLRGFGFRVGTHYRLSDLTNSLGERAGSIWELFAYASAERMMDLWAESTTQAYGMGDFVTDGSFTGAFSIYAGIQLTFGL